MTSRLVEVETPDGISPAMLYLPNGDGSWPAISLFHDAGGIRDTIREMGDRLSRLGYVVLVPDIYYRNGPYEPVGPGGYRSREAQEKLMAMMRAYKAEMAVRDAGACADYLIGLPETRAGGIGTTGYCLGGWISLHAAASQGERVAAAASFHAPNLALDRYRGSPHHNAAHIKACLYVAGATDDEVFPDEQRDLLERTLMAAGVAHTVETYPAHHGFAVPDNDAYDVSAAERHWQATERFFGAAFGS